MSLLRLITLRLARGSSIFHVVREPYRQHRRIRMSMRNCTRLSNGFSRKIENHIAAVTKSATSRTTSSGFTARCACRLRWRLGSAIMFGASRKSLACSGELQLADDLAYWDQAVVTHHVVTSATFSDHEVVTLRNELIPRFNHGLQ